MVSILRNLLGVTNFGLQRVVCLAVGAILGWKAPPSAILAATDETEAVDFFETRIRPVLGENCYKCHSVESKKRKGGLWLDSRAGILEGGDSGPVLVPGHPEKSRLIEALQYKNPDLQM